MIGIIMAGGKSSRINNESYIKHVEKLLYKVPFAQNSPPLIVNTINALIDSDIMEKIFVVSSSVNSPKTVQKIQDKYSNNSLVKIINSKGAGYSQDLKNALQVISKQMCTIHNNVDVLVISGDMPFLDSSIILQITDHYAKDMWTCIVISKAYAEKWDTSFEYEVSVKNDMLCYYTGISLLSLNYDNNLSIMLPERHVILDDHRIAISINTKNDYTKFLTK